MRESLGACAPRRSSAEHVGGCSPRRRLFAAVFVVSLLVPVALLAQDDRASREGVIRAPTPPAAAVAHYERGRQLYLAGRYREALTELKAALALDPYSPNLVYNVARVNEDLAELDEAIKYYRRYRSLLPPSDEEEREKTATTIRRLQGAKDEQMQRELERQRREGTLKQPAPLPQSDGRADAVFWVIAGTGLALAAGGGVTGFLALRREKEVGEFVLGMDGTVDDRNALRKQADDLALASDVLSAAAGVAILSAAILFFSRSSDPTVKDSKVSIAPSLGGLRLSATF